ncbi:MAG: hypothetical protein WAW37_15205, partial [Syntrophobacteraceae bacterium]
IKSITCLDTWFRTTVDVFMLNASMVKTMRHYKRYFSIFQVPKRNLCRRLDRPASHALLRSRPADSTIPFALFAVKTEKTV